MLEYKRVEPTRQALQHFIHHPPNRPQRMIGRHAPLRRYVAEHGILLKVVSSHWASPRKYFRMPLRRICEIAGFFRPIDL